MNRVLADLHVQVAGGGGSPRGSRLCPARPARIAGSGSPRGLDCLQRRRDPDGRRQPDRRTRQLADPGDGRGAAWYRRRSTIARPSRCQRPRPVPARRARPRRIDRGAARTRPRPRLPPRSTQPGLPISMPCARRSATKPAEGARGPGQRTQPARAQLVRSSDRATPARERARHRVPVARQPA